MAIAYHSRTRIPVRQLILDARQQFHGGMRRLVLVGILDDGGVVVGLLEEGEDVGVDIDGGEVPLFCFGMLVKI